MIKKDILYKIIKDKVDKGTLSFGWDGQIKEFNLVNYKINSLIRGCYLCDCSYLDQGMLYTKSVNILASEVTYIERDEKLKKLGL